MSSFNASELKTFTALESLPAYTRVKLSGAGVVTAGLGAADVAVGVTQAPQTLQPGSGTNVPVRLNSSTGSTFARAAKAIAANAPVYGAAGGRVSDAVSGPIQGYALNAAFAIDDVIEVLLTGVIA